MIHTINTQIACRIPNNFQLLFIRFGIHIDMLRGSHIMHPHKHTHTHVRLISTAAAWSQVDKSRMAHIMEFGCAVFRCVAAMLRSRARPCLVWSEYLVVALYDGSGSDGRWAKNRAIYTQNPRVVGDVMLYSCCCALQVIIYSAPRRRRRTCLATFV